MTLTTNNKTYTTVATITTDSGTTTSDWYVTDTILERPWTAPVWEPFEVKEPLPPFFCPKHKEIGEEIIEVVEKDGKKHYYCRKCVEEIIKKRGEEVDRWEDDLTKRDFEEDVAISSPRPNKKEEMFHPRSLFHQTVKSSPGVKLQRIGLFL